MPMRSQAQRALMHIAASRRAGAGGVSQKVAKEVVAADKPGKLPARVKPKPKTAAESMR